MGTLMDVAESMSWADSPRSTVDLTNNICFFKQSSDNKLYSFPITVPFTTEIPSKISDKAISQASACQLFQDVSGISVPFLQVVYQESSSRNLYSVQSLLETDAGDYYDASLVYSNPSLMLSVNAQFLLASSTKAVYVNALTLVTVIPIGTSVPYTVVDTIKNITAMTILPTNISGQVVVVHARNQIHITPPF